MFNQIRRYTKKVIALGPVHSVAIITNRLQSTMQDIIWRRKAQQGRAHHTWLTIAREHKTLKSFDIFFESHRLRSLSFVGALYADKIDKNEYIKNADFFVRNCFDLLGSGQHCFTTIDWHTDFRLRASNSHADVNFDPMQFYRDIKIDVGANEQIIKDIKVPWELSRFNHLFVLGKAYSITHDEQYAQAFADQVSDWLEQNPYLLGVNWVCPMEVGLRAINWIVAFQFFKDSPMITNDFWQQFSCSLYDHMIYLEHNWEIYDGRTSNHYLSNLVGYLYLCWFFADLDGVDKKRDWCINALNVEMKKQVFAEGADYEGSTYYHQLVTELFYHAYLVLQEIDTSFDDDWQKKLSRMINFINWCTPTNGSLVSIGDNDSGRVLYYGLPKDLFSHLPSKSVEVSEQSETRSRIDFFSVHPELRRRKGEREGERSVSAVDPTSPRLRRTSRISHSVANFPSFGLSIIKTDSWHVTLRHHAYNQRQPSGHYHNDVGSITLAVDGVAVIVDPGSFIYTPSEYWRNYFRSARVHNSFFLKDVEPVVIDERLFALDMPECKKRFEPVVNDETITMMTQHDLYQSSGLRAQRTVELHEKNNRVTIADAWLAQHNNNMYKPQTCWNFTLSPEINVQRDNDRWLLLHQDKPLLALSSSINFEPYDTWVSPAYGVKVRSIGLRAQKQIGYEQEIITTFERFID